MPKTPATFVAFLLDRSGSMQSIRDDTIGAFNTYLGELRKAKNMTFTFLQFDSMSIDTIIKHEPVSKVPDLTRETFVPRASTPLIDACYKTIKSVEEYVSKGGYDKVAICFQTDGCENCSREHTMAELHDLIKEKTDLGWDFSFMGASIDAYAPASAMGIGVASTVSYDSSNIHTTRAAFASRAINTMAFASGAAASSAYTDDQKMAAGDKLDPGLSLKERLKAKHATPKPIVDEPKL